MWLNLQKEREDLIEKVIEDFNRISDANRKSLENIVKTLKNKAREAGRMVRKTKLKNF